jgi:hypothetical protein
MNAETCKSLHVIDKFLVTLRCVETITAEEFFYVYVRVKPLLNSIREAEREPS